MLYDTLKIVHIVSATLFLVGVAASVRVLRTTSDHKVRALHIQSKTLLVILPFALLQLATGFTMMSLKHYSLSDLWVKGSLLGFIVLMSAWFAFLYFLFSANQTALLKTLQKFLLTCCALALLFMIFFMANKP